MAGTIVKTVCGVIDAPRNRKSISELKNHGVEVFRLPEVSIRSSIADEEALRAAKGLGGFDLVIFTDIYSVGAFLEIIERVNADVFELDGIVVCAMGEAVVDRLRYAQVHSDIVPSGRRESVVIKTIKNYLADPNELGNLSVLGIGCRDSSFRFMRNLRTTAKRFVQISVYKYEGVSKSERMKIITLIDGGAIDNFVFFSAEDVENLALVVAPTELNELLSNAEVTAADPTSFQALREHGLKPKFLNR